MTLERAFEWIGRLALRRPRTLLGVAVVVMALCAGLASRLSYDTDVLSLVPRHNADVDLFKSTLAQFGTADVLMVALDVPAGGVDEATQLADLLAAELEALPEVASVDYRVENPAEYLDVLVRRALLFMTAEEVQALSRRLDDATIGAHLARARNLLTTPQAEIAEPFVRHDPLGLTEPLMARFGRAGDTVRMDLSTGYYLSPDRSVLILVVKPKRPAQDIDFAERLLAAAEAAEKRAVAAFREEAPESAWKPRIGYAGTYVITVADKKIIMTDGIVNSVVSIAGVALLFVFAFRGWSGVGLAMLPLAAGLAMTFALAELLFGRLSTVTSGLAAMLVGLGIDFSVVMYGRYAEERNAGASVEDAVRTFLTATGPPVAAGAITTAATLFAFTVTDFRGLFEFGILTGAGILLCFLAVVFLQPALLAWRAERRRGSPARKHPQIFGFGAPAAVRWAVGSPRLVLALAAVLTVVAAAAATRVRFDDDIQNMRARGNPGIEMQERLAKKFGTNFRAMMLVVRGRTEEDVLAANHRMVADLDRLVAEGVLTSYDSVTRLAPPPEQQHRTIAAAAALASGPLDAGRIAASVRRHAAALGFREDAFDAFLSRLPETLAPRQPLALADLESEALRKLAARYLRTAGEETTGIVYLYPAASRARRQAPPELVELARRHGAGLTGLNVVSSVLRRLVWRDAARALGLGFLLVLVLLWWNFRNWRDVGLALVPLVLGLIWSLGGMGLAGMPMNMMNIFVTTMIIGIGVDYGIHMLHRFREHPEGGALAGLQNTGKSVAIAALTTLVGFGSLITSHYPGLASMGLVAIFGAGFTCLLALTVLPAILVLTSPPPSPAS